MAEAELGRKQKLTVRLALGMVGEGRRWGAQGPFIIFNVLKFRFLFQRFLTHPPTPNFDYKNIDLLCAVLKIKLHVVCIMHTMYLHGTWSHVRCIMDVINASLGLAPDRRPSYCRPGLKLSSTFIETETREDRCQVQQWPAIPQIFQPPKKD